MSIRAFGHRRGQGGTAPGSAISVGNAPATERWDELMEASLLGDAKAYHQLLTKAAGWLTDFYVTKVPSHSVVSILEDTLVALHNKRATYTRSCGFVEWMKEIARYKLGCGSTQETVQRQAAVTTIKEGSDKVDLLIAMAACNRFADMQSLGDVIHECC